MTGVAIVLAFGIEGGVEAGDGVAPRARDLGVRPDEREPLRHDDVVEAAAGGEGERGVALLAVGREARRDVVDTSRRSGLIGGVAGEAVGVERGEEAVGVLGVAGLARDLEVGAGEGEGGLRVDDARRS